MGLYDRLKQVFTDSVIYGLNPAASVLVGLFLVPIFTRIFQPYEYGTIDVLRTFFNFSLILVSLSMSSALFRFYITAEKGPERKTIASSILIFSGLVAIVASAAIYGATDAINPFLLKSHSPDDQRLIRVVILTLPLAMLNEIFSNILRCEFLKFRYSVVEVGRGIGTALLSIYLVVFLRMGVIGVFWAALISYAISCSVGFLFAARFFSFSFSAPRLGRMLVYSIPLIPSALGYWAIQYSNRYFLLKYCSLADIGLYTIGAKLAYLLSFFTIPFNIAWSPFSLSIHKEPDAKRTYSKVFTYYTFLTTFIATLLIIFSKEILSLLTTPDYIEGYKVVAPLSFGMIAYGAYYIFCVGLNITKKTVHVGWTTTLAAVSSIVLNIVLIPPFGIIGAAVATFCAYLVAASLVYIVSQRHYPIKYELVKVAKIVLLCAAVIGLAQSLPMSGTCTAVLVKLSLVFFHLFLAFTLNIFDAQEKSVAWDIVKRGLRSLWHISKKDDAMRDEDQRR